MDWKHVIALAVVWSAGSGMMYLGYTHNKSDPVVSVVIVACAYYLSKWIILGKETE